MKTNAIIPTGGNMALLDNITEEGMAELLSNIQANSNNSIDDPEDPKVTYNFEVDGSVIYSIQAAGTFGSWMASNPKFEEVMPGTLWSGPTVQMPNIRRFAIFSNQNPLNVWQLIGIWDSDNEEITQVLESDPSVVKA